MSRPLQLGAYGLAVFLLLLTFFDALTTGPLRIEKAQIVNPMTGQNILTALPFQGRAAGKHRYHFYFTYTPGWLDQNRSLILLARNCFVDVSINEQRITLLQPSRCEWASTLTLPPLKSGRIARFHVLLDNPHADQYGLTFLRGSLLTAWQTAGCLVLALYLAVAAYRRRWTFGKPACAALISLGIFVFSFAPLDFGKEAWRAWLSFFSHGLALAALCALMLLWPFSRCALGRVGVFLRRIVRLPAAPVIACLMLAFLLLAAALSQILFGGVPHIADSHTMYMQSKIFASGHLYAASHPLPRFFDFQFVVNNGKYFSKYFPGHIALLAGGQLAGLPWLINPLCGALTILFIYLLGREIGGKATGMIAAALMLVSPFVVFMSAEFMSHATCLLFITAFFYGYVRLIKTRRWTWGLAAGLCIGYACLTRPQEAVPLSVPVALHALWTLGLSSRRQWPALAALIGGFGFFVLCLLYYNAAISGSPWQTGYNVENPGEAGFFLRFFYGRGWARLGEDLLRANAQIQELHRHLFGWPTSSLLFVFLLFALSLQRAFSGLLLACAFSLWMGLLLVIGGNDGIFGPRYVYEATSALIVLTALCLARLPVWAHLALRRRLPLNALRGALAALVISFIVIGLPYRVTDLYRRYGADYWEGNADYYHMLMRNTEQPALVFMKRYEDYRLVYFTQPPTDENPVIFALDRGEENQQLMNAYPDRTVYVASGWNLLRLR